MRARFVFFDGEELEAETDGIVLDRPVILAMPVDQTANNELVEVSVASLKMIRAPAAANFEANARAELAAGRLRKVVVHFRDGKTLRCYRSELFRREVYGTTHFLLHAKDSHVEQVSIPHTATKAIFLVRQFDGREPVPEAGPRNQPALAIVGDDEGGPVKETTASPAEMFAD
jgi:hypothetical protein